MSNKVDKFRVGTIQDIIDFYFRGVVGDSEQIARQHRQSQLIINFNSLNMKSYSPMRVSLIQMEITPAKRTVDCEINSWMETHNKRRADTRNVKPMLVPVAKSMRSSLNMLRQKRL